MSPNAPKLPLHQVPLRSVLVDGQEQTVNKEATLVLKEERQLPEHWSQADMSNFETRPLLQIHIDHHEFGRWDLSELLHGKFKSDFHQFVSFQSITSERKLRFNLPFSAGDERIVGRLGDLGWEYKIVELLVTDHKDFHSAISYLTKSVGLRLVEFTDGTSPLVGSRLLQTPPPTGIAFANVHSTAGIPGRYPRARAGTEGHPPSQNMVPRPNSSLGPAGRRSRQDIRQRPASAIGTTSQHQSILTRGPSSAVRPGDLNTSCSRHVRQPPPMAPPASYDDPGRGIRDFSRSQSMQGRSHTGALGSNLLDPALRYQQQQPAPASPHQHPLAVKRWHGMSPESLQDHEQWQREIPSIRSNQTARLLTSAESSRPSSDTLRSSVTLDNWQPSVSLLSRSGAGQQHQEPPEGLSAPRRPSRANSSASRTEEHAECPDSRSQLPRSSKRRHASNDQKISAASQEHPANVEALSAGNEPSVKRRKKHGSRLDQHQASIPTSNEDNAVQNDESGSSSQSLLPISRPSALMVDAAAGASFATSDAAIQVTDASKRQLMDIKQWNDLMSRAACLLDAQLNKACPILREGGGPQEPLSDHKLQEAAVHAEDFFDQLQQLCDDVMGANR